MPYSERAADLKAYRVVLWRIAEYSTANATDRTIDLGVWKGEIPVTWFQSFNPLMIFVFTPPLVAWWARRAKSGDEPATITKLSVGCFVLALSSLLLALAAWAPGTGKASWLWLLFYFAIMTVAELYFSPIGLSLVSRLAPVRSRSLVMGVWLATSFAGNLFAGWIGTRWSSTPPTVFFLAVAAIAFLAGLMIEAGRRPLLGLMPREG